MLSLKRFPPILMSCTKRTFSSHHTPGEDMLNYYRTIIGNREIVGYGTNGMPSYFDSATVPMPAIRFKEPSAEIMALREKEKGDWRLLSIEEKKKLYRASFCQTFAEFQAPKGEWMATIGYALILCSVGMWMHMLIVKYAHTELPDTFTPERKRAQLIRMIDLHVNPIMGLTSNWDYEKKQWKRIRWDTPENPYVFDDGDGDEK